MHAPDLTRAVWQKSSYSGADNNNCVEVALGWRKSSYSGSDNNCVEVAAAERLAAVRDSKNPTGPVLTFPAAAWRSLLSSN